MTFLHLSLLAGGLLAVAPIAFHLLGRKQPKAVTFPAIRFVRQTAVQAQKGWSIKRWLLLSMRVLLILLMAFALASPRVPSADFASYLLAGIVGVFALLATGAALTAFASRKSPVILWVTIVLALGLWGVAGLWFSAVSLAGANKVLPTSSGPIAAALIIDTSPTMGYQYRNKTRMEEAKEMAAWLMDRLPVGSQIAIVNTDSSVRLMGDRSSANRQLEKTSVEGRAASLPLRISNCIDSLWQSELERREIYVLTDLSQSGWRDMDTQGIAQKLTKKEDGTGLNGPNVLLQIIDVSVPQTEKKNWSIKKAALSQQSTVPGASVTIDVEVEGWAGSGSEQMTVELYTESTDKDLVVRGDTIVPPELKAVDRQLLDVPDGGIATAKLTWKDLAEGTNNAQLRITRPDPLAIDNVSYLSVEAKPQGQSLVVANDLRDSQMIALAINPEQYDAPKNDGSGDSLPSLSGSKIETYSKLGLVPLADYANIVLYDPKDIDADTCDRLREWVSQGGAMMIVLGSAFSTVEEWNESPVKSLLPGTLKRLTRRDKSDRSVILTPAVMSHPMWSIFERPVEEIPWAAYPIFKHWDLEDLTGDSYVLMRYTQSGLPAIVEEVRGKGRIVTWTLPYPEPFSHRQGDEWSELFRTTSAEWPGFALFVGTVRYLASWSDQQLNYFVDQPALLNNSGLSAPLRYQLFDPKGEQTSLEANEESVVYNYTRFPGTYRLKGLRPQGPVYRSFSVNLAPDEISLQRVDENALSNALGLGNFRIAKDPADVESSLGEGRYGREMTPFIMVLVVMLFMAEQTMASRFYASQSGLSQNRFPFRRRGAA